MPAPKKPRQPHLKEVPRPRSRSAKPSFDIATEPIAQEAAASWVYRPDIVEAVQVEAMSVEPAAPPPPPPSAIPRSPEPDNPFLMVGEGLFLISMGTMKLTYYAMRGMIVAPIRLAARLLT